MRTNIYTGRSERNHLVNKMSILSCAIVVIALTIQLSNCVIMPPRLYNPSKNDISIETIASEFEKLSNESGEPYTLSINEGASKSVSLDSRSVITINLNRAISEDLEVQVSVFSSPDLVSFDQKASKESISIKYLANTFGDRLVPFYPKHSPGHAEIVSRVTKQPNNITIDDSSAYISVDIYRNWSLNIIVQIVGWIYFFAWSISFYFQFLLNYQRKSVVGLNFDFLAFNLLGFTCYSIYNMSLLFSYNVQQEYYKRYTYSRIPVEYNDLFFGLHATVITLLTVIQCCIYERGEQQVSSPATIFLALSGTLGFGLYISSLFSSAVTILNVIFYLSYVKLVITIIKYVPQAYMNYKRKATTGWSIHNIILDFTGGSFSFMQMLLIAYNYNDWISIFGNFTKFGLALISMKFDILFLTQHYVLYRGNQSLVRDLEGSTESVPSPVISQSIRSANNTQTMQQQQQSDSDEMTERDD